MQELNLPAQYLDIAKYMGHDTAFNLNAIKGYSGALFKAQKTPLRITLMTAKARPKPKAVIETDILEEQYWRTFLTGVRIQPLVVLISIFLCVGFFILGVYQKRPIQDKLSKTISLRPVVTTVNNQSSYAELVAKNLQYKTDIETYAKLIKHEFYNTEILQIIPELMPRQAWLYSLEFKKEEAKIEFIIHGTIYINAPQKEIELVHEFLAKLRSSPILTKYFPEGNIAITAIDKRELGALTSTDFIITCTVIPVGHNE